MDAELFVSQAGASHPSDTPQGCHSKQLHVVKCAEKKMHLKHQGESLNDLLSQTCRCKAGRAVPLRGNLF